MGSRIAVWYKLSPPANMAWVRILDLVLALLRGFFSESSGLSSSSKTQTLNFNPIWKRWTKSLSVKCATVTANSNFIYLLVVYLSTAF